MASETEPHPSMEVIITLTPTDKSEASKIRKITLTKENPQVQVGRASKNPNRGLQPSDSNAIFNCPIISRRHAYFTASPEQKKIYVVDLESTHGTFVGDYRVERDSEHVVKDQEIVTFGVTVTNGAFIYRAKAFRVESKWQRRQYILGAPLLNKSTSLRISDLEAEADAEEASVHSREPSVQIMESNIRTANTYSCPSECDTDSDDQDEDDDDDLEISPPDRGGNLADSAVTTPEQRTVINVEEVEKTPKSNNSKGQTRDLNLKGPKLQEVIAKVATEGSSQTNPIDLEDRVVEKTQTERPHVLHSTTYEPLLRPQNMQDKPPSDLHNTQQGSTDDLDDTRLPSWQKAVEGLKDEIVLAKIVDEDETESEDEGPEELPIKSAAKRTNITDLLNVKPVEPHKPSTHILTDAVDKALDSAKDEDPRIERMIRDTQRRIEKEMHTEGDRPTRSLHLTDSVYGEDEGAHAISNASATAGSDDEEDEGKEEQEQEEEEVEEEEMEVVDEVDEEFIADFVPLDGFEATRDPDPLFTQGPTASEQSDVDCSRFWRESLDIPSPARDSIFAQRAPSPSDAALARISNSSGLKTGMTTGRGNSLSASFETTYPSTYVPDYAQPDYGPRPMQYWGPKLSPFNHNNHPVVQTQETTGYRTYPSEEVLSSRRSLSPDPFAEGRTSVSPVFEYFNGTNGRSLTKQATQSKDSEDPEDLIYDHNPVSPEYALQSRTTEEPSSKLNISNLVNAYHAEESSRSIKRKAADISSIDEEAEFLQLDFAQSQSHTHTTQKTPLPDAQPRDAPLFAEIETSISQGELIEPTVGSIVTTFTTETSSAAAEEPARKKIKTNSPSSSSASGVGKFLTGVAVGVVGVAAAFLATIPASVHEEVLMDLAGGR